MDEMNIVSKFTTNMISKIVKIVVRKKLGYNVNIRLNEVKAKINDGETHIHLDVDASLSKDELLKILKDVGFN